nr:polysaccharide biosynthesis C-terminal domain-containing protein [Pseudomonas karstica]
MYLAVGIVLSVVTVAVYSLFQEVEASAVLIVCVALVLLTEHLSFEINSFVFAAQKSTWGAILFFIKTGLWALLALGGMLLGWVSGIASVLWLWVAANVVVIVAGYLIVVNVHKGRGAGALTTASVWKAGLPFYLGTGLIAVSQYAERFLILDIEPYASLGKYVYAWSAANTLQALSYAVVAVVGIPVLAKRYQNDKQALTVRQLFMNQWVMRALVVSGVVALMIYLFFNVVLDYVGTTVPRPDNKILGVLIFSFALRAVGDIVWGGLIASKNSRVSFASAAICLLVSLPVSYVLIKHYSIYGAAWGNVFSITVQLGVIALLTRFARAKVTV